MEEKKKVRVGGKVRERMGEKMRDQVYTSYDIVASSTNGTAIEAPPSIYHLDTKV